MSCSLDVSKESWPAPSPWWSLTQLSHRKFFHPNPSWSPSSRYSFVSKDYKLFLDTAFLLESFLSNLPQLSLTFLVPMTSVSWKTIFPMTSEEMVFQMIQVHCILLYTLFISSITSASPQIIRHLDPGHWKPVLYKHFLGMHGWWDPLFLDLLVALPTTRMWGRVRSHKYRVGSGEVRLRKRGNH